MLPQGTVLRGHDALSPHCCLVSSPSFAPLYSYPPTPGASHYNTSPHVFHITHSNASTTTTTTTTTSLSFSSSRCQGFH
ncbi:hypothetical protein E2C01_101365 [Portunus trituberculatus]|uniref:Uncharacterized protein n=1 Tax=Portunus trituberculatus TaxID=210409 RepID=A0A5B7KAI6_PORTR|nr:hypothetical protein [Portunus trituberculatus]